MKRISDKKLKKFENKKRKIKAFIDLINNNEKEEQSNDCNEEEINSWDENQVSRHVFTSDLKVMSELRKKLSVRFEKERPKFFLENELLISESIDPNERLSLSLNDVQSFLLSCLLPGPRLSCPPNWCKVIKPTKASKVAIFALDCDLIHPVFSETDFKYNIRFDANDDWINSLLNIPLSNRQLQKMHSKRLSCDPNGIEISSEERISRTKLLLSPLQMSIEKYPLLSDLNELKTTKSKYSPVSDCSPIYSLDCEMCFTIAQKLETTRITVVDENCDVIYDTLVKPKNKIINYLTKYSGVTKKLLDPINVTLEDVHNELNRILPEDAILCGQSLNCDLQSMQLIHPYIIDTSVIYNLSGIRQVKSSLKHLSSKFLNMNIQNNNTYGHDSAEDAIAAMKLVKLKLSMGLEFGDRVLLKKDSNFDVNSTSMYITSYLENLNTKLSIYYDHIDLESNDKLLTIFSSVSKRNTHLTEAINRVIHTDKAICIVLIKSGHCFIKF